MSVLVFPTTYTEEEQIELADLRQYLSKFYEDLELAKEEDLNIPENQWELMRLLLIDEVLREMVRVTLYEFQAIEYLVGLYSLHIGVNIYEETQDILRFSENTFLKHVLGTGRKIPAVKQGYKAGIDKGYSVLLEESKDIASKKFYGAVISVWRLVAKHCELLQTELTSPLLTTV